jgi:transcription-repair coupling factor
VKHIFNKEFEHLLGGGTLTGMSPDLLVVFLNFLSKNKKKLRFLVLAGRGFASSFLRQKEFFSGPLFYYPEQTKNAVVPGFETQHNLFRSEALVGLSKRQGGVCISLENVAYVKNINKKTVFRKLALDVGQKIDRDSFCEKLFSFGYKKVDYVYNPKEFSLRGEIVDVYPENIKDPLRVVFAFNVVEEITFFNIDSQRSIKDIKGFVFYDLLGEPVEKGKSLFAFFDWDLIINLKKDVGGYTLNPGQEKLSFLSNSTPVNPSNKKELLVFGKKVGVENVVVFITRNSRKNNLKKLGFSTQKGLINTVVKIESKNLFFVPDLKKHRKNKNNKPVLINNLSNTSLGDLLVHVSHGVGKFGGLVVRGPSGYEKEYIKLIYKDGGTLFVPINKANLVHKYVNVGGKPTLNKLGGKEWEKNISKTKKEIEVVSDSLVEIYNSREKPRGFSYIKSVDFESAIKKSFPFKETRDQKQAIKDVLLDLRNKKPMDRLICGDVGFGKTEVALRAIVRVVAFSKQVVLLCPTTVLSDQHYITAKERLDPLGVSVALLSRFQTKKAQTEVLEQVLTGNVNLVIGTHRLLSDDVVMPFLGLLIIDEEHRFGVKHKESIRALKNNVDVLSMSATPIPRTLQQSMLGIRDISRIETPPTTRKPISTFVEFFSWKRTEQIIEKELLRGGQVYFLHNNVESIEYYVEKIQNLFPNERVDFIHGQQNSKDLEKNLLGFFGGKISVLVCSTIIESGLDVSNANCIIINNPQNLGLSQLYQIRGRVGRSSRQASCYLFIPKKTKLSEKAYKRLKTIERHTSLGSGYNIATNDLDIRGGGAVFGYKQSGQISRVGLEHYNNLLKKSVGKKLNKKEPGKGIDIFFFGKSLIPLFFVKGETERFSFYTKINKATSLDIVLDIQNELIDRYGKPPKETINYLNLSRLKISLKGSIINSLSINKNSVIFILDQEKIGETLINNVLSFKNKNIQNRKFEETKESFSLVFYYLEGFDWYKNINGLTDLFFV